MFKINLIPEVKQEQLKIRKMNATVTTVSIIVVIIMGVMAFGLLFYNVARQAQLSSIKSNITKTNQALVPYQDLENTVLGLQVGLTDIKSIFNSNPNWVSFFDQLEQVTPGDIQITNLTVDNGAITISATGQNVASVDRFIKSFSNYKVNGQNLFSDVMVDGYQLDSSTGDVTFSATMTLNQGVLW
jgi:Tfp pilus assembly protein PilN